MGLLNDSIEFARETLKHYDAGHNWSHSERVLKLSRKIRELENNGDLLVIDLSAVLHDIGDTKFHAGEEEDGGDMACEFLLSHGLEDEKAQQVRYIINHISFKKHFEEQVGRSIEFQIVQDADRLDAMGAIGIARAFNYGGYKNRAMYDPDFPLQAYGDTESYKKSEAPTINHFYEKLFKLKAMMNTNTGRRMAEERHEYMVGFVEKFKQEWQGLI